MAAQRPRVLRHRRDRAGRRRGGGLSRATGRRGLAALFGGFEENDDRAPTLGQTLLGGLMGLMLVDPATAPTARELTDAMRMLGVR